MLHVNFSMFVDRPGVMAAIDRKQRRVLTQTGAFGRTIEQRQIRPAKRGKKSTTIVIAGRQCIVPPRGMVRDAKSGKPVRKELARQARIAMSKRRQSEEPGKPPRRGPTDKLRKNIFFGVDGDTVVIGPQKFGKQPQLSGASSIPELLETGGIERWLDKLTGATVAAHYAPHPFAAPTLPIAERKFKELIERIPLK